MNSEFAHDHVICSYLRGPSWFENNGRAFMTSNRQLALIRNLCGLGLPPQTLAPSLLPVLRRLIPSHSAAVFWVDERMEMTGLYAERLLPPEAMARYYEKHYKNAISGFPAAFGARAAASDPVSIHQVTDAERASDYFREILAKLDAYQILYGVLRNASVRMRLPSISTIATSTPSSDVPLMMPATRMSASTPPAAH